MGRRSRHSGKLPDVRQAHDALRRTEELPAVISGRGFSNDQTFISFRGGIDPSGRYPEMPMSHSDPKRKRHDLKSCRSTFKG